jgi:hypothetical protein
MVLELILEKSIFKELKMKRIDYEQYLQDFNCVHGNELKKAIYEFFEKENEIKRFLDLVTLTKGLKQYDNYTLLWNRFELKGYSLTGGRWNYSEFQDWAPLFFLCLFFNLREEYHDFFIKKSYRFLRDLLK